jgi:hypothetical protein
MPHVALRATFGYTRHRRQDRLLAIECLLARISVAQVATDLEKAPVMRYCLKIRDQYALWVGGMTTPAYGDASGI